MFLFLALSAAAPAAAAPEFQSTGLLDTIVGQFTGKGIGEEGGARAPVDTRLKLASCAAPQLEWRTEAHDAVVIRCMTPEWRIFVPVRAAEQPRPAGPAPAAAQQPVTIAPARLAPVIKRGDPLVVEAGSDGFSITREGVAMSDAAPGARLLVRVENTRDPIQAIAVEPGRAKLPGWEQ